MKKLILILLTLSLILLAPLTEAKSNVTLVTENMDVVKLSETNYLVELILVFDNDNEIRQSFYVEKNSTYQLTEYLPEGFENYVFNFWVVDGVITQFNQFHLFTIYKDTELRAIYGPPGSTPIDPEDPNDYTTFNDLPLTSGSIYISSGETGKVQVIRNGSTINLYIIYNNQSYLLQPFTLPSDTDLTPFDFNNAFYFSDGPDKFIVFNHDESKSTFTHSDSFIPYTVLNLSNFEWKHFGSVVTRIYTVSNQGNVVSYFYVDQFVIDNLMSIDIIFNYRYLYPLFTKGQWNRFEKRYMEGVEVSVQLPWYRKISIAGLITSIIIENKKFNEIITLTPTTISPDLMADINNSYKRSDPNFERVRPDLNLFQIFLGTFHHNLSTNVQIYNNADDPEDINNLQIAQFTYMTEGKINTIYAKDIEVKHDVVTGGGNYNNNDEKSLLDRIIEIWENYKVIILAVGLIYIGFKLRVFDNKKSTIIFIIFSLLVLFLLGLL